MIVFYAMIYDLVGTRNYLASLVQTGDIFQLSVVSKKKAAHFRLIIGHGSPDRHLQLRESYKVTSDRILQQSIPVSAGSRTNPYPSVQCRFQESKDFT